VAPRSFLIPRAGRLMGRRQLRRRVGSEVGTLLYVLGHLGSLLVRRGALRCVVVRRSMHDFVEPRKPDSAARTGWRLVGSLM